MGAVDTATTVEPEVVSAGEISDATSADSAEPDCPGGAYCPCTTPIDCNDGLCLETPDGGRCSTYCGDGGCAAGWSCKGQKGGSDLIYFCIPDGGLFCRPCTTDSECQGSGHAGARCVDYGDAGGFCGVSCSTDLDCASGQSCQDVTSVQGGAKTKQCVVPGAKAGVLGLCSCSPNAMALGLQTTCYVSNGRGPTLERCKGSRSCGAGGLGVCEPLTGDAAVCQQAQCLDPNTLLPLAAGTPCDDGRTCTVGDTCQAGVCVAGQQTCPCEPGFKECDAASGVDAKNLCLGAPFCAETKVGANKPFACVPNPAQTKVCDGSLDDTCNKNACVPLSGACTVTAVERTEVICDLPPAKEGAPAGCRRQVLPQSAPSAAPTSCDDGLPCSPGDLCGDGQCKPTSLLACGCQNDVDCQDDGDLCNGLPYCDKSGTDDAGNPVWACKINPATVVSCDTSTDGSCIQTACEPQSGSCKKGKKAAFTACDDGIACTVGDVCDADGQCKSGTWNCCKSDADCAKEEDGDLCNGTLFCNLQSGTCENNPATVVTCPTVDNTVCQQAKCQKATGQCALTPVNIGKTCDDGIACSDLDTCDAKGQCKPGKDTCPCKVDADCAQYDDGDLCNGTLYCNPIAGPDGTGVCRPNPKTVVVCPSVDDTFCKRNVCDKKSGACGMVDLPAQTTCDADGTACTSGDACDGKGQCVAGMVVCECQSDADCASKEDGDLCNGTLYCDKEGGKPVCKLNPATLVSCPSVDDTVCQKNLCQPKSGTCVVQALPTGAPCSDGEPCTEGDGCDGKGQCVAGQQQACGCKGDADCVSFDDGDVCNGIYVCQDKACAFTGKALLCDDGNPCTLDSCDKNKGCFHDAKKDCTLCKDKAVCDDGNVCTVDVCDNGVCVWEVTTSACSDGNACTVNDICLNGSCTPGATKTCTYGNPCTVDSCDPTTGCKSVKVADETPCTNDGSKWCQAGACVCGIGLEDVPIDVDGVKMTACAALGPVWGNRPITPVFVYSEQTLFEQKVVNDSQTKLMWQQTSPSSKFDWAAAKSYCDGLLYAGYADWRLPSVHELASLVDYTVPFTATNPKPAIDTVLFPGAQAADYLTASSSAGSSTEVWLVAFNASTVNPYDITVAQNVQCVRGSPPAAQSRYAISAGGGVVTDNWTKLQWQQAVVEGKKDWSSAKSYCNGLSLEGSGWRLPTVRELHGLVDKQKAKPAIDVTAFPNTPAAHFWSATPHPTWSNQAWGVAFDNGGVYHDFIADAFEVRCVRGI